MMKLHFDSKLDYQLDAIEATCDLFSGQELGLSEFTVTKKVINGQEALPSIESDLGIGNRLQLLDEELLENLRGIQLRNGLAPDPGLESKDFTIEMETGTGKTYVYLRSAFELNKRYGFTKFVIVVPSVAIKEGVYKTLQITEDHFRGLYAGVPFNYFTYDSNKLDKVRSFATSPDVQVMVVTVGAINKKDVNNLYKDTEKTGGEKPIDLIRATRPIVIVDEPQSVDGGLTGKGKEALDRMDPLCTLRYSATHSDPHHMIYRLNAVDAYAKQLVKQIEVASATVESGHNKPYVRLVAVANKAGSISAKVQLDCKSPSGVERKDVTVLQGDDLAQTTSRDLYEGCRIGDMRVEAGAEYMELQVPGGEEFLNPGEAWGDVDGDEIARLMIKRTIREHFDKELRLRKHGVKVLSLFFVDAVDRYRQYDEDGNQVEGEYAKVFEEEFAAVAKQPAYTDLFNGKDLQEEAAAAHDGYFSIDKKQRWVNTEGETNQKDRDNAERAYSLIMRDKEKLLSFDTPLRFIFSHSALREGWDNPNVFQICSLRDIHSEQQRRQTIGRGLRLCVNQEGERLLGFDINTLTVMATEAYEAFANGLQKEIESDTGIRFGVVEPHEFVGVTTFGTDGGTNQLGVDRSEALWEHLRDKEYISSTGKVQDALKQALKEDNLELPGDLEQEAPEISEILKRLAGGLEIKNADERREVRTREAVLDGPEFKALWKRVCQRTTYRVKFDNQHLIESCIEGVKQAPAVAKTRLQWRKANIEIGEGGVTAEETAGAQTIAINEADIELPDILTVLQDRTKLTRKSLLKILLGSGRTADFRRNPQAYLDLVAGVINGRKRLELVDGIKYQRLGDDDVYSQELFEDSELTAYVRNSVSGVKKSVLEPVVVDSEVERKFAHDLEHNDAVRVYAKLPSWFTVPTPLGRYNPDWAVLLEKGDSERLYFVVETKGTQILTDLRDSEAAKIACGVAHFAALDPQPQYTVATSLDEVLAEAD